MYGIYKKFVVGIIRQKIIFEFSYACLPSGVWRSVSTSILHLLQSKFCDACFLCLNSCGFFFIMKIVAI